MAIHSHAFGRVTLTGEDARKFKSQFTHGKPSKAAEKTVTRGVKLSRQYRDNGGEITLPINSRNAKQFA